MKRVLLAVVVAGACVATLFGAERDPVVFSAGFDADLFSSYVYRNAVNNDELVFEPGVQASVTFFDFLSVGGEVWQNWNLTDRQCEDGAPMEMNETDYSVYVGADVWRSDDGEYVLNLRLSHDWFTYRYDTTESNEIALRIGFDNPFVNVYGQYSQAYWPTSACYFEVGLAQDWKVGELVESENDFLNRLSVGFDWNVSFASGQYFTTYLYGPLPGDYNAETDEYDEKRMSGGIGGTTIRGELAYEVCDHFTVGLVLAFTATLSGEARESVENSGRGDSYKDLVWGGLQAKLDF